MPIISRFFEIIIFMLWRDHAPPHFHAKYAGDDIAVEIESGAITGSMSKLAIGMVQEWRELHKAELMENWRCTEEKKALRLIDPLE